MCLVLPSELTACPFEFHLIFLLLWLGRSPWSLTLSRVVHPTTAWESKFIHREASLVRHTFDFSHCKETMLSSAVLVAEAFQALGETDPHTWCVTHNDDLVVWTAGIVEGGVQTEYILVARCLPGLLQVWVLVRSAALVGHLALLVPAAHWSLVAAVGPEWWSILSCAICQ